MFTRAFAILCAIALCACGPADRSDIQGFLDQASQAPTRVVEERDLEGLPAPVQRYLRKAGVLGARQVRAVRSRGHGRLLFNGSWIDVEIEQYLTATPLTRNFLLRGTLAGVSLSARDSYCDHEGRMSIRLFDDVRFQEMDGPEMDRGQLVTIVPDLGMMPTAWLSDAVRFEPRDDRSANVSLTDGDLTVRGVVHFDENDDLSHFVTEHDRFEDVGGTPVQKTWTAECRRHEVVQGLRVCTYGVAIWNDEEGPREYGHIWSDEVQLDAFEIY